MRSLPAATPLAEDTEAIRLGLLQGQVSVRYQPIVRIRDGRPAGAEALARWEAPTERCSPESFVPIVESAGLGLDLSIAVARRAAREFAVVRRSRRRGTNCRVSVNLPLAVLLVYRMATWPPSKRYNWLLARTAHLQLAFTVLWVLALILD